MRTGRLQTACQLEIDLADADSKSRGIISRATSRNCGMGERDAERELHAPPDKRRHLTQELQ